MLVGRLQIFNNWSPYLVADPKKIWVGLEYFCYDTDDLWKLPDDKMIELAKSELAKDRHYRCQRCAGCNRDPRSKNLSCVLRHLRQIRHACGEHVDIYSNLYLVGRNGMHKYNNQDHSMLTAMISVDNIIEGRVDKQNIWDVNTEEDYHETKQDTAKKEEVLQETR